MRFELKQARFLERLLAQQGKRTTVPTLPPNLRNPPQVRPWLQMFWVAYHDLKTDRHYPEGPIPWTSREDWARKYGLDETATDLMHHHVLTLDLAYQDWMEHNRPTKSGDSGDRSGAAQQQHAAHGGERP